MCCAVYYDRVSYRRNARLQSAMSNLVVSLSYDDPKAAVGRVFSPEMEDIGHMRWLILDKRRLLSYNMSMARIGNPAERFISVCAPLFG